MGCPDRRCLGSHVGLCHDDLDQTRHLFQTYRLGSDFSPRAVPRVSSVWEASCRGYPPCL